MEPLPNRNILNIHIHLRVRVCVHHHAHGICITMNKDAGTHQRPWAPLPLVEHVLQDSISCKGGCIDLDKERLAKLDTGALILRKNQRKSAGFRRVLFNLQRLIL